MPTRKQRRRQQKLRRHEFEDVYYDADGNEISAEEYEALAEQGRGGTATSSEPGRATGARAQRAVQGRGGRTIQPPSWRRVAKRGLIFAPIMFILFTLIESGTDPAVRVLLTLQMMLLFIPFSYLMDTLTYRMARRRLEGAASRRG